MFPSEVKALNRMFKIDFQPDVWQAGKYGVVDFENYKFIVRDNIDGPELVSTLFFLYFAVWANYLGINVSQEQACLVEQAFFDFFKNFIVEEEEDKDSIFVLNRFFNIVYDDDNWGNGNYGESLYFEKIIRLRKDLNRKERLATLFHEILHIWNHFIPLDINEEIVRVAEEAFLDYFENFLSKFYILEPENVDGDIEIVPQDDDEIELEVDFGEEENEDSED